MHHDGEVDIRGTYTAVAVAALCNILTDEFKAGIGEYVEEWPKKRETHRDTQRDTERHRETHRETQRNTETHRDTQ